MALNGEFKIKFAAWFAWVMLNIIGRLVKIRYIGEKYLEDISSQNIRCILSLWHGRMFIPIFAQRNKEVVAMVSQHADGEFIARAVERMGYITVRGSSTRGGGKALREMVKLMRSGHNGAMMVDGPKGPKGQFKPGTIILAQLSGARIVPMTHACSNAVVFNSWDNFIMAKPFSKVVVAYGKPIEVPRKLDEDALKAFINFVEEQMNDLVDEAENSIRNWQ